MLTPGCSSVSVMPEVFSRASMFLKNGFPPKDRGNDDKYTHFLCNVKVNMI
jgi:hypothetical protein